MRGRGRFLRGVWIAAAAVSWPGVAWGQALPEGGFEQRVADVVESAAPAALGRAWERVVTAALERLEALQRAAPAPAPEGGGPPDEAERRVERATTPQRSGVLPAESADEGVPTVRWGSIRVEVRPVIVDEPTNEARRLRSTLPGIYFRMPWIVP